MVLMQVLDDSLGAALLEYRGNYVPFTRRRQDLCFCLAQSGRNRRVNPRNVGPDGKYLGTERFTNVSYRACRC